MIDFKTLSKLNIQYPNDQEFAGIIRKLIWKTLYTKSDLIITMTENTKKKLIQSLGDIKHIKTILNPVIDNKIYIKSEKKIT